MWAREVYGCHVALGEESEGDIGEGGVPVGVRFCVRGRGWGLVGCL